MTDHREAKKPGLFGKVGSWLSTLTLLFVLWYALALLLPQFGAVNPLLGVRAYGPGTEYALPLLPKSVIRDVRGDQPGATGTPTPTGAATSVTTPTGELVTGEDGEGTRLLKQMTTVPISVEYVDNPCGLKPAELGPNVVFSAGCVTSDQPTRIVLSNSARDSGADIVAPLVAHELGHVYQARLAPDFLASNAAVKRTFPASQGHAPIEQLADCMAMYRTGKTSGAYLETCTPAQLAVAAQVWAGVTPGNQQQPLR